MTSFVDNKGLNLCYQWGSGTDIGGGRENQDDYFVWKKDELNLTVACVLDGHGREVGKVAAASARLALIKYFDDSYEGLLVDPTKVLIDAHEYAHSAIKQAFKVVLEAQGFLVQETQEGYLMKRKTAFDNWGCVHGGTSCSIIAIIGSKVYTANVGDSSAILCSGYSVLQPSQLIHIADAASPKNRQNETSTQILPSGNVLVITAEHSPESPSEFGRLRDFRKRDNNPLQPALSVVYDSSTHDKGMCHEVFDVSKDILEPTGRGSYYKNVRKEWASLVATPSYARFQDALAFTRSLGDLHLHTYGVTHLPEVHMFDIAPIFESIDQLPTTEIPLTTNEAISRNCLCIVLATDGVWDNWLYEDVGKFVMDNSCLQAVDSLPDGTQKVTDSFILRNGMFSKRNFGSQADNATATILYIRRKS